MPNDIVIDQMNLGRLKVPSNVSWDEVELRELVYERFKQDYDNFGYGKWDNFDNLWDSKPTQSKLSNIFPKKA
jgi:hypothetical protein